MFKSGKLDAISATPTLELGIDIGDVDAIVSNIVPVNRLVQRIGRAARRGQQGYAFLALGNDPISQYYKSHPDDYLTDQEFAYTDPENPFVKEYQVLAMACDRPISMAESKNAWDTIQKLVSRGLLSAEKERFSPDFKKAMEVLGAYSIRGIGSKVDIKIGSRIAGDRALPQALEELHRDAIYFLAGRRYRVGALHFEKNRQPYAELEQIPSDYPYYTKALTDECIKFARAAGYKKMTLWTHSVLTAARAIYEKAGFRLTGSEARKSWSKDVVAEYWDLDLQ